MSIENQIHAIPQAMSLAARLIQFGLDPKNWILQEQSADTWLIQNRECEELQLLGKSIQNQSRWDWEQIEMLSFI